MVGFYEIALVVTLAVCAETNAECFDGRCVDAETAVFAMDAPGFAWFWNPMQVEPLRESGGMGTEGVWNTTEQHCETMDRDYCNTTECCDSGCDKGSARTVNINESAGGTQNPAFDAEFEWTERSQVEEESVRASGGQSFGITNHTNDIWDETEQSYTYLDLDWLLCSMKREMGVITINQRVCEWRNTNEQNDGMDFVAVWHRAKANINDEQCGKKYEHDIVESAELPGEDYSTNQVGELKLGQIQGEVLGFGESQGDYERGRMPSPARIANFDTVGEMAHTDFCDFGCEDGQ